MICCIVLQYFVNYKLAPGSSENSTEAKSDEIYRDYFLSSLCFVAQVPNVTLNGFNLFCRTKGWANASLSKSFVHVVVFVMLSCVRARLKCRRHCLSVCLSQAGIMWRQNVTIMSFSPSGSWALTRAVNECRRQSL